MAFWAAILVVVALFAASAGFGGGWHFGRALAVREMQARVDRILGEMRGGLSEEEYAERKEVERAMFDDMMKRFRKRREAPEQPSP
ncbi:MAG TPA: hypothetical protein VKU82_03130 [Planctomycetaceae bacterium]|nr:hypothetical protein [Planctomycetaceae bacterium]